VQQVALGVAGVTVAAGIVVPWRWLVPAGTVCAVLAVAAGAGALSITA
jgi:hypothetical protein